MRGATALAWCLGLVVFLAAGAETRGEPAREYGGRYTAQRLASARANCDQHEWAAKIRARAVDAAKTWVAKADEELWAMVPGQDLPRTIDTTLDRRITDGPKRLGCLKCGEKIFRHGSYPYEPDVVARPWKLSCPSCGVVFPTNDFAKYYASGIDERGLFNPKKADRSLLFNADHPDPSDPLHKFGVDDGFGYIDENGRGHRFVAYYVWKYWRHVLSGVVALSDAYVYTGDRRYAHKAAVLLDRIADVYPEMEWKPYYDRGFYHSDGNSEWGKIEGRIWETQTARQLADAYDKILSGTVGDADLFDFLKARADHYKLPLEKGTRELFVTNLDERLLRTIFREVQAGRVMGNEGMHQMAVTNAALALDTEPETTAWLDWVFAPTGGAVPGLIVSKLDRDGVSPEAGPGYALMWGGLLADMAGRLGDYPRYTKHNVFRDFPQFRATYTAAWRMAALGIATPNIGDSGETGSVQRTAVSPEFMATGYRFTRDPEIAIAAYRANGNSGTGLGRDIFAADPDQVAAEIDRIGKSAGPRPAGSYLMSGYGLATLESGGADKAVAVPLYYGRTIFHGHPDALNFDLFAFGKWLAPDLGYPEFATNWPSRNEWNNNTISHNTVIVDGKPQVQGYGGHTRLFKSLPGFSVTEIDGQGAYPGTKEYARTLITVETPSGGTYVVDLFRAAGGSDHVLSFHGPPGAVTPTGLSPTEQPKGTYAGADVPFAAPPGKFPRGYQYLYNVRKDTEPPTSFTLDWHADAEYRGLKFDDVHLKLHVLTACNDVALADGDPAQNKPSNPRRLTYALMHRTGKPGLASAFVSVLEPYRGEPLIERVKRLPTASDAIVVLEIALGNEAVDTILLNSTTDPVRIDDGTSFTGRVALLRRVRGQCVKAIMIEGTSLESGDVRLTSTPAITGTVARMNRELSGGGLIWTDANLPTDGSLGGQYVMIQNDNERDACYAIRGATKDGALTKLDCGPVSFVRSYAGPTIKLRGHVLPADYSKGYLYDFDEGAQFRIPTHVVWERN